MLFNERGHGGREPTSIWESISLPEEAAKADEDPDGNGEVTYKLYCGVEEWCFQDEGDEQEKFEASPLPLYPPQSPSNDNSSKKHHAQRFRKRTGCGALIHASGSPRSRAGTWQARGKATNVGFPDGKLHIQ